MPGVFCGSQAFRKIYLEEGLLAFWKVRPRLCIEFELQ